MTVTSATNSGAAPATSTGKLSVVQQMLKKADDDAAAAKTKAAADAAAAKVKNTSYTDQDWYIRAKVAQLKQQINLYNNVPGLDPNGSIVDSLTDEANALVKQQQAKIKESQAAAKATQDTLEKANAQKKLDSQYPTAEEMLKRASAKASGQAVEVFSPDAGTKGAASGSAISSDQMIKNAQAKARGSSVNTSA